MRLELFLHGTGSWKWPGKEYGNDVRAEFPTFDGPSWFARSFWPVVGRILCATGMPGILLRFGK